MYTVFLADDEFKVINGLLRSIDWDRLHCEVIGYAQDGIEAQEKINRLRPDIVLIDIRMPKKSGLEVMRSTSAEYPCAFIIFSGYTEFEYAKEALQLKAVDYLIKPVNISEIEDSVEKAKQYVQQLKLSQNPEEAEKKNWLMHILDGGKPEKTLFPNAQKFFLFVIRFQNECTSDSDQEIASSLSRFRNPGCEFLTLKKRNELILFCASDSDVNAQAAFHALTRYIKGKAGEHPDSFYWGKGSVVCETSQIETAYIEAADMVELCEFFCAQQSEEYTAKEHHFDKKELIRSVTRQIICANSRSEAETIISDFFGLAIDSGFTSDQIKGLSLELYYSLKYHYQKEYAGTLSAENMPDDYFDHFTDLSNLEKIKNRLLSFYDTMNSRLQTQNSFYQQRIIHTCKTYIEEHLEEPITLSAVARFVNMNPTYLSHMFKKETGITLFDYITDRRISEAKYLLRNTWLKIFEIAKKTGYPDQRYFCQVFKKKVGMTAAEYRNQESADNLN